MTCPLCESVQAKPVKVHSQEKGGKDMPASRCLRCGLIYLDDYASDRSHLYGAEYSIWGKSEEASEELIAESKRIGFRPQLKILKKYIEPRGKRLLDVGTGKGYLLDIAKEMGFDCYGVEISKYSSKKAAKRFPGHIFCGPLEKAKFEKKFDVITMTDLVEHIPDPNSLLESVVKWLNPGGLILIMTPNTDSCSNKIMGAKWFQYKYEHVIYWNKKSLNYALNKYGFTLLSYRNNTKKFNLEHYNKYMEKYSLFGLEKLFRVFYKFMPLFIRRFMFTNPMTGEFIAVARKAQVEKTKRSK